MPGSVSISSLSGPLDGAAMPPCPCPWRVSSPGRGGQQDCLLCADASANSGRGRLGACKYGQQVRAARIGHTLICSRAGQSPSLTCRYGPSPHGRMRRRWAFPETHSACPAGSAAKGECIGAPLLSLRGAAAVSKAAPSWSRLLANQAGRRGQMSVIQWPCTSCPSAPGAGL